MEMTAIKVERVGGPQQAPTPTPATTPVAVPVTATATNRVLVTA